MALFGRRLAERVVRSSPPASENLHISGCEQVQQIASLFDHLVGAGEQRDKAIREVGNRLIALGSWDLGLEEEGGN